MDDRSDTLDAASMIRNRRQDAMFVAAYLAVIAMIYIVVYSPKISEYAQGVLTLCIGNFIGYLTAMYNFETGNTRNSVKKDDTIQRIAEAAPAAQVAAVGAAVAAATTAAVSTPTPAPAIHPERTL